MSKVLKFYYMPESPPSRAVEMVASLVGLELQKHHINLFAREHRKEEYAKINPQRKVPFLIDGDLKMGESRSIMRYLVNKTSPNNLYPSDVKQRAKVDELLDFDLGTLYASGFSLFRPFLHEGATEFDEQLEKEYRRALEQVEERLKDGRKFLTGHHLTIGDISVTASLTLPVSCGFDYGKYPHINEFLTRAKGSIPKYSEINDKGIEGFANFIKSRKQ